MKYLPLYPRPPAVAIEAEECLELDPSCSKCDMRAGVRTVCLPGEGEPGGLLVVGESPGRNEDAIGRPFVGASGRALRGLLAKWWTGPVAIDNAIRCSPGAREVKDKHVHACRGYLAETIAEARPTRILALGGWSAYSLTGRSIAPFSTRRGYGHLVSGRFGKEPIPVFYLLHPAAGLRNRFVQQWFESDMKWALTCPAPPLMPLGELVFVVNSPETAVQAVAELSKAEWSAMDVETSGIMYDASFRLLCVSFCAKGTATPWAWDAAALADPVTLAPLVAYLGNSKFRKMGANVNFDHSAIELTLGIKVRGVRGDVRLWRKLLEPEADGHLDKMVELVGMGGIKEEAEEEMALWVDKVKKGMSTEKRLAKNEAEDTLKRNRGETPKKRPKLQAKMQEALDFLHAIDRNRPELAAIIRNPDCVWQQWAYAIIPKDMLLRYNARDTVSTARLGEWLEPQLVAETQLDRVRTRIVEPAAYAIRRVEGWGVKVDRSAIETFDGYLGGKLSVIREKLDTMAGADFDPDSHPQVRALLFDKLRLKPSKETKTGLASTDAEVLESLESQHPVVKVINDHRTYAKLKGTYAEGMIKYIRPSGRIHTSILLDGARSGRTSSSKPNLQNIPRAKDSAEGKMARDCFVAPQGFTLLQLDYSQLELRIAAMLSGDKDMLDIFLEGVDYHQRTAELISRIAWGIPPEAVESKHRSMAKNVNFGILYGKTANTLAKEWGVSRDKAQSVVDAIMGQFRRLAAWCAERLAASRKTGLSWTWWDGQDARRRPLWRIADQDDFARSVAEHGSVNTPIQGTASDFCIASLVECVNWIEQDGLEDDVRLVLPVHDSLMFEVRHNFVREARGIIREIMLSHNSNGVPLEVDAEVGLAWGSLIGYKT